MPAKKNRKSSSSRATTADGDRRKLSEKKHPETVASKPAPAKKSAPTRPVATAVIANVTPIADLGKIWERIGKVREPGEFRISCIRPDDLLVCEFIFGKTRKEVYYP